MSARIVRQGAVLALSALTCAIITGCSDSKSSNKAYQSEITYTEYGVPHIKADNYGSLGYGIGYVQAKDNMCTLSEQILKVKGEKSRHFGAGPGNIDLYNDIGYKALDYPGEAKRLYKTISRDYRDLLEGYVAGFNRSLNERNSPQAYPSPCRGAEWVTEITSNDLLAYHLDLAGLASSRNFLAAIAAAKPPVAPANIVSNVQLDPEKVLSSKGIGSNGWGIGAERSEDGSALLLGNPHFPWDGELRFYEQHLTIPGELDVTGVGMVGLPVVTIGFNNNLGWTHTVSQSKRFTLYQLTLSENDPLKYVYDGKERDITSKDIKVTFKGADDSLQEVKHTVYFSHFGPMVDLSSMSSILGWSGTNAITYRDANKGNVRILDAWLAMGKAKSKAEFFKAFEDHQGIPWVNTIMAADDGTVSYIDGTQAPQLSKASEDFVALTTTLSAFDALWQDGAGNVLLPGNSSDHEWVDTGDAGAPGLVPFKKAPQVTRNDYVFNANSSHWLTHVDEPLEGYSLIYGPEKNIRSTRTRYNAQLITDNSGNGLAGSDNNFSLAELQAVLTHNGSLFAGDFQDEVVQRCEADKVEWLSKREVDLTAICSALADWDGQYNLDSRGAHVMREFLAAFRVGTHRSINSNLFAVPYDENNPATTPSGLKARAADVEVKDDPVLKALSDAAVRLETAGIAPDAKLGDIQYLIKAEGKDPLPLSGGYSYEGVFNMTESSSSRSTSSLANNVIGTKVSGSTLTKLDEGEGDKTAYRVNYGTGYVLALKMTANGPQANMFLGYGQAHDPESPFFMDQTEKFSRAEWRPVVFKAADIEAQKVDSFVLTNK